MNSRYREALARLPALALAHDNDPIAIVDGIEPELAAIDVPERQIKLARTVACFLHGPQRDEAMSRLGRLAQVDASADADPLAPLGSHEVRVAVLRHTMPHWTRDVRQASDSPLALNRVRAQLVHSLGASLNSPPARAAISPREELERIVMAREARGGEPLLPTGHEWLADAGAVQGLIRRHLESEGHSELEELNPEQAQLNPARRRLFMSELQTLAGDLPALGERAVDFVRFVQQLLQTHGKPAGDAMREPPLSSAERGELLAMLATQLAHPQFEGTPVRDELLRLFSAQIAPIPGT